METHRSSIALSLGGLLLGGIAACTSILGVDGTYEEGAGGPGSTGAGGAPGVSSSSSSANIATGVGSSSGTGGGGGTGTGGSSSTGTGGGASEICEAPFLGQDLLSFEGRLPRAGFRVESPVVSFYRDGAARLGETTGEVPTPHGADGAEGAVWLDGAGLAYEDGGLLFLAANPQVVGSIPLDDEPGQQGPIFGVFPGAIQLATLEGDLPRFRNCLVGGACTDIWPTDCPLRPTAPGGRSFGASYPPSGVPTFHRLCAASRVEVLRLGQGMDPFDIPDGVEEVALAALDPPALILPNIAEQAVSLQIGNVREIFATGGTEPRRPAAALAESRMAAAWEWNRPGGTEIAVLQCALSNAKIDVESCDCRTLDVTGASYPGLAARGPRIVLSYEVEGSGEVKLIELPELPEFR